MMKIVIHNLYGCKDGSKSYYRKLGDCFDFVSAEKYATDLSKDEADKIMNSAEYYCKFYNASHMTIE